MKYMGSKARIANEILPIILRDRKEGQYYVEPFVGGANRIGSDYNNNAIKALLAIRDNISNIPKNNTEFTEQMFNFIKNKEESNLSNIECFALFNYSFSSRWKSGWSKNKRGDDYVKQGYNSAIKQSKLLQQLYLVHSSYNVLFIPNNSIIYCDPPYYGTAEYKGADNFNHVEFWEWCRTMVKEGHSVFVSEYNAPEDFVCILSIILKQSLGSNKKSTEKLFVHKSVAHLYQ